MQPPAGLHGPRAVPVASTASSAPRVGVAGTGVEAASHGRDISRIAAPDCQCCSRPAERSALLKDGVFPGCQHFPTENWQFSTGWIAKTQPPAADLWSELRKTALLLTAPALRFVLEQDSRVIRAKQVPNCSLAGRHALPGVVPLL